MFKSTITSKGQLTVPKEIRKLLDLDNGDTVIFKMLQDNTVTFEKSKEYIECPICLGNAFIEDENMPCFFCDTTKKIIATHSVWELLHNIRSASYKYGVAIDIISQGMGENSDVVKRQISIIKLRSKVYPEHILNIVQDYLQMRTIEEYAPRRTGDESLFKIPSDAVLNDMLSLLTLQASKDTVQSWFRTVYKN